MIYRPCLLVDGDICNLCTDCYRPEKHTVTIVDQICVELLVLDRDSKRSQTLAKQCSLELPETEPHQGIYAVTLQWAEGFQ